MVAGYAYLFSWVEMSPSSSICAKSLELGLGAGSVFMKCLCKVGRGYLHPAGRRKSRCCQFHPFLLSTFIGWNPACEWLHVRWKHCQGVCVCVCGWCVSVVEIVSQYPHFANSPALHSYFAANCVAACSLKYILCSSLQSEVYHM